MSEWKSCKQKRYVSGCEREGEGVYEPVVYIRLTITDKRFQRRDLAMKKFCLIPEPLKCSKVFPRKQKEANYVAYIVIICIILVILHYEYQNPLPRKPSGSLVG